jgi:hypothetical protein
VSVRELLDELDAHVERFRTDLSHLVPWQTFERAGAVVTELEVTLGALGVPVAPLEAMTQGVLGVAQAVHAHLTTAQSEADRQDIEGQIAALQAKLGLPQDGVPAGGPVVAQPDPPQPDGPPVKGTGPLFKEPAAPASPEGGTGG